MSGDIELTDDEARAIAALKRLAKRWPDTLWIFAGGSGGDNLTVLKVGADGERVMGRDQGVDQSRIVGSVKIPSDGGDW